MLNRIFLVAFLLIAHYYKELLNYFTRATRDRDGAEDIVQEAYVRVLGMEQTGQLLQEPRALLYKTARNVMIDRYRRSEVRGEYRHDDDEDVVPDQMPAATTSEPEVRFAAMQAVEAMLSTIDNLPLPCREAFILHRFDGLSHAEIAARMGISQKMVEYHIKVARDACRRSRLQFEADAAGRQDFP